MKCGYWICTNNNNSHLKSRSQLQRTFTRTMPFLNNWGRYDHLHFTNEKEQDYVYLPRLLSRPRTQKQVETFHTLMFPDFGPTSQWMFTVDVVVPPSWTWLGLSYRWRVLQSWHLRVKEKSFFSPNYARLLFWNPLLSSPIFLGIITCQQINFYNIFSGC